MPRDLDQLGDLQSVVMDTVWSLDEPTVKDVLEALPEPRPAYTTVLTVLQKLTRDGWLAHRAEGRSYRYRPLRSREEAGRSVLRRVVDSVFDGDRVLAVQRLLESERLSEEELAAIEALLEARESGGAA